MLSEATGSLSVTLEDFWSQFQIHVDVGIFVTAPPFTAGPQVRFTVAVMASHIL